MKKSSKIHLSHPIPIPQCQSLLCILGSSIFSHAVNRNMLIDIDIELISDLFIFSGFEIYYFVCIGIVL